MGPLVDGLECCGCLGVAAVGAKTVDVLVVRPAVGVGVLVGVRVPGVEDPSAVPQIAVEVVELRAVGVKGGRNGGVPFADGEGAVQGGASQPRDLAAGAVVGVATAFGGGGASTEGAAWAAE